MTWRRSLRRRRGDSMPAAHKDDFKEETTAHVHNWYPIDSLGIIYHCVNGYHGGKCITLKCGRREYERRCEEWDAYLDHCRTSDSYRDYLEMKKHFPVVTEADREAVKEIQLRIARRVRDTGRTDEYGEPLYEFDESQYVPTP